MGKLEQRLKQLERRTPDLPTFVVYKRDGVHYDLSPYHADARALSQAEVDALEREHTLIVIEYVDNWRDKHDQD
jgi:hypothetical protein